MRIHLETGLVAYDGDLDASSAREVAWYGDSRIFQRQSTDDGIWERVLLLPDGSVDVLEPRVGANGVRAGLYGWMTRLDEPGPTVRLSSDPFGKIVGFEGAVAADAPVMVTLDLEKIVATVHMLDTGTRVSYLLPGGIPGSPWVDQTGRWMVCSCFRPDGVRRLLVFDLQEGTESTPKCLTDGWQNTPVCVDVDGTLFVAYQTDQHGLVIHPVGDPSRRMVLAPPPVDGGIGIYGLDMCKVGDEVVLAWAVFSSQLKSQEQLVKIPVSQLLALEPVPFVPPTGPLVLAGSFFTGDLPVGTASVWVRGPLPPSQAVIAAPKLASQVPANRLLGIYTAADPANGISLEEQIAIVRPQAESLKVPMFVYDEPPPFRSALVGQLCGTTPYVIVPQWYLQPGESAAEFAARIRTELPTYGDMAVCPAIRCHTGLRGDGTNVFTEDEVIAGLNEAVVLLQAAKAIGFLLFAYVRDDGATGRPKIKAAMDAWLETATTLVPSQARAWAAGRFPEPQPKPVSEPMVTGTPINMRQFLGLPASGEIPDRSVWPRGVVERGDNHPLGLWLQRRAYGLAMAFVKFDPAEFKGSVYELWSIDDDDDGWVHHLQDIGGAGQNSFVGDTRWMKIRSKVGHEFYFDTTVHEVVFQDKNCVVKNRVPFGRRMWVHEAWDRYDCGPDLGIRRVICVVYDPTTGIIGPGRYIERYFFAEGAGWVRWESYASVDVYPEGLDKPVFNKWAVKKDFWRVGGLPTPTPQLTGCESVPQVPAFSEALAINLGQYTQTGEAPLALAADYIVTGAVGPVQVELKLDDVTVATETGTAGTLRGIVAKAGTYDLIATVTNDIRSARTWAKRTVTVSPALEPSSVLDMTSMTMFDGLTYNEWMARFMDLYRETRAWISRASGGQPMSDGSYAHATYRMRPEGEAARWVTPRRALLDAFPSGAIDPPEPPPPPLPPQATVKFPAFMASYYTSLTDPDLDILRFAEFLASCGVTGTRAWLLDAWALGERDLGGRFLPGQYDGAIPYRRLSDGRFDLADFNQPYFDQLRHRVEVLNRHGVFAHVTLLELYTWSDRKAQLPFVPDVWKQPFRNNVNGVKWGDPDDATFFALPDVTLTRLIAKVVETLDGTAWLPEVGNEMPEKAMHWRIIDALRAAGWTGEITVNRNEDTPGQPWNMDLGGRVSRLAFHGKLDMDYLDEDYPDEVPVGRPRTFREMWTRVDPALVILSSDGGGGNPALQDSLKAVACDALRRGGSYEHQLALKRNRFYGDGTLRMADLQLDAAFLRAVAACRP